MGLLDLHLGPLEADVLDIAHDADGEDHPVHRDVRGLPARVDGRGHIVGALPQRLHRGAGHDLHALLLERLLGEGGDLGILHRQHAVENLHHRDLGAEIAVEARELHADGAAADDQQRFRHGLRHHRFLVGPDQPAVRFEPRQRARPGAGRQDDVPCGQLRDGLAVLGHGELALAGELPLPVEHRDLVLLQEMPDAVRQLAGHAAAALHHLGQIEAHILGGEAEGVRMLHQMLHLGRAQQRLGRDAAPVEADAAQMLALDDRGLQAELRRADRGDIPAGARSDDCQIEFFHSGTSIYFIVIASIVFALK